MSEFPVRQKMTNAILNAYDVGVLKEEVEEACLGVHPHRGVYLLKDETLYELYEKVQAHWESRRTAQDIQVEGGMK